jgi:hypothetical protein
MQELIEKFRVRLSEYRYHRIGKEMSIHVNAMDIAICLSEYALFEGRKIKKDEMKWFDAVYQLDYILGGSEWEDLVDYYDKLQNEVISNKLVEN